MTNSPLHVSHDKVIDDVDFLFEIGTLRHINRSWSQFGGLPFANVAEHSFRTMTIAMLIALREGAKVEKVVELALVHDIHETRTGDANYVQKMYRNDDVETAWREIEGRSVVASHIRGLRLELETGETLEAKIVKDADNLDCDLELREMRDRGSTIADALTSTREAVKGTLHTGTARHLFAAIQERGSHHWHLKARNRLTAGDWAGKEI